VLDVVLNLPGFSAASPAGSLLGPSLDLLLAGAALLLVPYAPVSARAYLRIAISVVIVALLALSAAGRFGPPPRLLPAHTAAREPLGWALAGFCLVASAGAVYAATGLVVFGFQLPVVRSVFTLVVAFCAVLQVITGTPVFAPGELPRIAHLALAR
jgi:hypothetical protein